MDTNTKQMINKMLQAKRVLENSNPTCKNNIDYKKINNDIKLFLFTYCTHEWKTDDIDISPEKSQKITYCEICESTIIK